MKTIAICGHFGANQNLLNGQTIKTKTLRDGLKKYSDYKIVEIDTYGWKRKPVSLFKNIDCAFKECDSVIMLPAHNGVKIFAPLFLYFKKKYRKKIFYDVIGGWLPEFLKDRPKLSKILKKFDGIWVETNVMKNTLENQGFYNVCVVPNFKDLEILSEDELIYPTDKPYKLCTFSRVMKEKGIEDAVNVVKFVNEKFGNTVYTLDIYGQVDSNQTEWFENLKQSFPDYIRYGGMVPFNKSTEVLKEYFALLFPTYYEGEGFAGTLIDAMAAGIPVIATDWRYNGEIITDDIGFAYPTKNQEEFKNILLKIADNPQIITDMKKNCVEKAKNYQIYENIKILKDKIDGHICAEV